MLALKSFGSDARKVLGVEGMDVASSGARDAESGQRHQQHGKGR